MKTNVARRVAVHRGTVTPLRPSLVAKPKTGFLRFSDVDSAVAAMRPSEPMYCLFPNELATNANLFLKNFCGSTYYAVKVNPDPYVLTRLYAAGIRCFDVASLSEVKLVRGLFPDASLAFMHPVKTRKAIRESYFTYGVRVFVLDSLHELDKILEETDGARDLTLFIRLAMPEGSAYHSMSGKFGAPLELAVRLMREIGHKAAKTGMTFHVGSQTLDPASFANAIRMAGEVRNLSGVCPDVLDVGGGFPVRGLGMETPPLTDFFDVIREEIAALRLPPSSEVWCEPGAALAQTSSTLIIQVLLRKGDLLYINDGGYGNLSDLCWNKRRNDMRLVRLRGQEQGASVELKPFMMYGATCDTPDYLPGPFMLPDDVAEGDWIAVSSLGAYSQTFRTNYNGFFDIINVEIQEPSSGKLVVLRPKNTGKIR
jgi:ornithine decarboxylase